MRLVGKIKDAHGMRGELYILVFSGDISWLEELEEFGLGLLPKPGETPPTDGVKQVLPCEKAKPFKDGFILKTPSVSDRTTAENMKGQGFYIPDELLISEPGETIFLGEILGFELRSPEGAVLGEVVDFSSNGLQDLLVIKVLGGKKSDVPFVDDFIVELNFDGRFLVMDLPEGLLDLSKATEWKEET